jgi:hypothetical protein
MQEKKSLGENRAGGGKIRGYREKVQVQGKGNSAIAGLGVKKKIPQTGINLENLQNILRSQVKKIP